MGSEIWHGVKFTIDYSDLNSGQSLAIYSTISTK